MAPYDIQPHSVFTHPDYPGAELWIVADPSDKDAKIKGIQIHGATQEQLPFLLLFAKQMAPGIEPDIIS